MSARGAGGTRGPAGAESAAAYSRRITPFWILQTAEVLSVVALADLSLHVDRGGVLAVAGGIFAALALTADGPLGIVRIFSRKLHVVLVVVTAALVALSPVVSGIRPDIEGILILEIAAVGIIRLATLVNTDPHPVGPRGLRGSRRVVDASATVTVTPSPARASAPVSDPASTPPAPEPEPSAPPSAARSLFPSEEQVGGAARWAGRAAGAASSAASRTTAKHAPAAKAQAKRSIRSAGWLVGRATSRPEEPPAPPAPSG
ncbi:MAG TPA: hypothetical protein VHU85_02330 [Acidimicrobiales bacterium]|jgi:hypothetical protein|nr:hypothetical protein [Acidimicrobiales bacterium]